ncbi:MAG: HD domain-containing protein [Pseudoflavonifractor sp.]|nr:HD domain-containing protein [Pseudoflavonifractor sp.]
MDYRVVIERYYPAGSRGREVLVRHSRQVADKALGIARRLGLPLAEADVEAAAMLHDIGIFLTDAPSIGCTGSEPYIAHGILGADLLRRDGVDERFARVAERHTGAGLTASEIESQGLPLPHRDMLPESLLEKLICYADKFYSKGGDMREKPLEAVIADMARHGDATLARFMELHSLFGGKGGQKG